MQLPMFPLRIVLFPQGPLPLRIFEARYVDMVRRCMHESLDFGVLLILEGSEVGPSTTVEVGTTAHIADFHQLADGLLGISCVGRRRFRVTRIWPIWFGVSCRSWVSSTPTCNCRWTMPSGWDTGWQKSCPSTSLTSSVASRWTIRSRAWIS